MRHDPRRTGIRRGAEALSRRIEETRALTGHPLRCTCCDRLSSGRATGWKMHCCGAGDPFALCPECDELEFG